MSATSGQFRQKIKNRKKLRTVKLALSVGFCFFALTFLLPPSSFLKPAQAASGIAKVVNYQGRLMNASGTAVGDGTYQLKLTIYNQASAGTQLWSASTTNGVPTSPPRAINVTVKNGLFSILLGDTSANQVAFPEGLFNSDSLFLGVTVAADSEMTPRKRLSAVPYAYNSDSLQGQHASNTVATWGGNVFSLTQNSANAATATRSAFFVQTAGTSNVNDFLIRGSNGSDVFTVTRQGNVTTTGNLQVSGATILNGSLAVSATSSLSNVALTGRVNSNLLPFLSLTYDLGSSSYRWRNIWANSVTTTWLGATTVSTTNLYINGAAVTTSVPTLQQVTTKGRTTTLPIQFAGGTSTGSFRPLTNNTYNLGSVALSWKDIYASGTSYLANVSSLINGNSVSQIANTAMGTNGVKVVVSGNYAYVGTNNSLRIYDVTRPSVPALVGSYVYAGNGYGLSVQGRYAYIGTGSGNAFLIVDVSNPSSPTAVGSINYGTEVRGVQVSGKYAFVSNFGSNMLRIVDISNPTAPSTIRSISMTTPYSISVQGRYAYVATQLDNTLKIVDLNDISQASVVGSVAVGSWAQFVYVQGRYAYVSNYNSDTMSIVDVSNPASPTVVGTYSFTAGDGPSDIVVNDRYAYVTNYGSGKLSVIDVSVPTSPVRVAYVAASAGAWGLDVQGKNVFVTTWSGNNLLVYNVSGVETSNLLAHSAEIGGLKVKTNLDVMNQVSIQGGLNIGQGGIFSIGSLAIGAPNTTSTFQYSVSSSRMLVSNMFTLNGNAVLGSSGNNTVTYNAKVASDILPSANTTYSLGSSVYRWKNLFAANVSSTNIDALHYVSTTNLIAPNIQNLHVPGQTYSTLATIATGDSPRGVFVSGRYAYITNNGASDTLQIFDVSDPVYPKSVGSVAVGNDPLHVYVSGRYAYVTNFTSNNLSIVDVSNPTAPTVVSTLSMPTPDPVQSVFVNGRYAYVGYDSKLLVVDVANPSLPSILGSVSIGAGASPNAVYVQGRYAYVGTSLNKLVVVDVSDPLAPMAMASTTVTSDVRAVYVQGRYAYAVGNSNGFSVVDVANPSNPTLVKTLSGVAFAYGLHVDGRYAYARSNIGGSLYVIDIASSTNPYIVSTISVSGAGEGVFVSGRYAYITNTANGSISIIDLQGIETGNLMAHAAEVGTLQVRSDAQINNQLSVSGGLNVGTNGISTNGPLSVSATSTLFDLVVSRHVGSDLMPWASQTYSLGDTTHRWKNAFFSDTVTTTKLYVNGTLITGGTPNLQQVTTAGRYTNLAIGVAGVSSTGDILPTTNNTYNLGSASRTFKNIYSSSTIYSGNSKGTGNISFATSGAMYANFTGGQTAAFVFKNNSPLSGGALFAVADSANFIPLLVNDLNNVSLGQSDTGNGGRLSIVGYSKRADADIQFVATSTGSSSYFKWNVGIDKSDGGKFKISSSTNALGTNDRFVIDGNGNVGINTSNPTSSKLVVAGGINPSATLTYDLGSSAYRWKDVYASSIYVGTSTWHLWQADQGFMVSRDGTDTMSMTNAGTLTLLGASNTSQLIVKSNAAQTNDNPLIKLMTQFGQTLTTLHSDNQQNLFMGVNSGSTNDQSGGGIGNYFIGYYSGSSNTIGARNIGLGSNALRNNPDGNDNLGIGNNALYTLNGGISNVAIGNGAMYWRQSGVSNVAVGRNSLLNDIQGSFNTAIGDSALNLLATSTGNTAVGYSAGTGNFASTYNIGYGVFVGTEAGVNIINGADYNTMVGYNAGWNNTSGKSNAYLGYRSGYTLTTGASNTFIGALADTTNNAVTNSMALGAGSSVTSSNIIRLGNNAITSIGGFRAWSNLSDSRLKNSIQDSSIGLNFIKLLRTKTFKLNGTSDTHDGFIAQDVLSAMTTLGTGFSGLDDHEIADGGYYYLDYSAFVVPLTNAVKTLDIRTDKLAQGVDISNGFATGTKFLSVSSDGTVSFASTLIKLTGISTSSTQGYDSGMFVMQGSGWDSVSSTPVTTNFKIFNRTVNATTSELVFGYSTGTNGITAYGLRLTNLGDTYVSGKLFLASKKHLTGSTSTYIFVDDTLAPTSTYIATNADGWQASTAYDYAERYVSDQTLEPGDVVAMDQSGVNKVKLATANGDPLIGIVSTKPGFITGAHQTSTYPIALAGRVPTKVSTANGAIRVGDYLTISDQDGVATKATKSGEVVGIAFEAYDKAEDGLISVFVKPQQITVYGPELVVGPVNSPTTPSNTDMRTGLAKIMAGSNSVKVNFQSLGAFPVINITPYGQTNGYWIEQVSDSGFTLVLTQPASTDLVIGYMATLPNESSMSMSDNTQVSFDTLTGQTVSNGQQNVVPPTPAVTTPTSTTQIDAPAATGTDQVLSLEINTTTSM